MSPAPLLPPIVNPTGVLESPDGYERQPRSYSTRVRGLAFALLCAFAVVATATTVSTLGHYCLTSHASAAVAPELR